MTVVVLVLRVQDLCGRCFPGQFKMPISVAINLGRYLWTNVEVSPGLVVKSPESMVCVQVWTTGLRVARWRYVTSSGWVHTLYTLLQSC